MTALCFFVCCGSRALYLAGTQATGADIHSLVGTCFNNLNSANVGLVGSVGFTVRVGYVVTEHNALSAHFTLCHLSAPPFIGK